MSKSSFINVISKIVLQITVFIALISSSSAYAQSLEDSLRAATAGDIPKVAEMLARGNSVDTTDADGNTLLMLASREGHAPLVSYLIEHKAAVNGRNKFGDSALMAASIRGKLDVVQVLVAHGAELDPAGWTPLEYAAFEGRPAVAKFLLDKGANKNAVAPNGFSALMLAVRGGHTETARILLYADPDVNVRSPAGDTALKLAREKGDQAMVDLLKRAGATE